MCKLKKSLYGLKQAGRKWYERLTTLLLIEGYNQLNSDHSLFTHECIDQFTMLLVYVDDIILAGNSLKEFDRIKSILNSAFKIKDLGALKYFLGLEVSQSKAEISICQRKYCLDLLHETGQLASNPTSTPMDCNVKIHQDVLESFSDNTLYWKLIGKLLYLTNTGPNITSVVQQLSQFVNAPTVTHFNVACRVLKYLKGTPSRGLLFPRDSILQLLGFSVFHERTK